MTFLEKLTQKYIVRFADSWTTRDDNEVMLCPIDIKRYIAICLNIPELNNLGKYLISVLGSYNLVYYEHEDSSYIEQILTILEDKGFIKVTQDKGLDAGKYGKHPFPFSPFIDNEISKSNYLDYSSEVNTLIANYLGDYFTLFPITCYWNQLNKIAYKKINYHDVLIKKVGVKSRYPIFVQFIPRTPKSKDKNSQMIVAYKDRMYPVFEIEYNKSNLALAMISTLLFVLEENKSAVLTLEDMQQILDAYDVKYNKKKFTSTPKRLMKYLRELISKAKIPISIKEILLNIFPIKGDFFRMEISLELEMPKRIIDKENQGIQIS